MNSCRPSLTGDSLRAAAALELRRRAAARVKDLWRPLEGPQAQAYGSPAFETLYGGAAGGGKTDLLLGLARQQHSSVLLLRRTYPDLEDSLIKRSREIYGDLNRYNGSKHVWEWLDEGRRIRFGHVQRDADVHHYQSAQFDLIGFDELTQFTRFQYEYMRSRARSAKAGQRVRIMACTNPGGEGHAWVREYWAPWLDPKHPRPAKPGEIRFFKRDAQGAEVETTAEDPQGVSRTFIPAKLEDNPYLGAEYRRILDSLPEPYRSQLLNGDWDAGATDDPFQVIPTAWIAAAQARWTPEPPEPMDGMGVDVAHGGDDYTVLVARHGAWIAAPLKYPGKATPDGQAVVALLQHHLPAGVLANIDAQPPSAYDMARGLGMRVHGVNFGARNADARDVSGMFKFANLRAEIYWRLREALDPTSPGPALALPPGPEVLADLSAPRWEPQLQGIQLEPKEDIKKRLGRSPDVGDAIAMACYRGATPALLQHYKAELERKRAEQKP